MPGRVHRNFMLFRIKKSRASENQKPENQEEVPRERVRVSFGREPIVVPPRIALGKDNPSRNNFSPKS